MQNLLETLKKAAEFLARKGLEKPRLEAEHLFAAGRAGVSLPRR